MGFIVNKRNMLFLGAIYMFGYPILMYFSGQPQLQQSALFMAVMILGATIGTTIFINSLEKSLETNEEYSQKIRAQKERLEKLNNERIRLLSIIAHDLRNPIGNIMNVVNFLLEEETTEAEKEKLLDIINKQNRKTYELLENLLLWSRSEQQLITPKFEKLNLREILQSVLSFFTESFRVKRIREFNTVNEKLFVHADKNMLEAILRNLLSNALKFSEDGSKIEIEAHEKGDNVVLAIRDYGIGMDEKTATRLFDSDFSDTRPGTKYESGAGFGMKLVKDLVRKNKGKIRVESTPGEGTVFYVTLPK
jgi:signal transduction histidine kinase